MYTIKDILSNIEQIYSVNSSLNILKDFERVLDALDVYVYDNWEEGELVSGPIDSRYWVECSFMWPEDQKPDTRARKRLEEYGCKLRFRKDYFATVRKIKSPDDIRAGTKKGKIDHQTIYIIDIRMPKKLIFDIHKGSQNVVINQPSDTASIIANSLSLSGTAEKQQLTPSGTQDGEVA